MGEIYDIFISYRRKGGFETAKHLNDLLVRDGYTVSFDIDTLREGRFDDALLRRINQCTDFVLIVDLHAFDRTLDPSFDSKKDWLRTELAYAIKIKKNIIPILLSDVSDFPSNLPDDISVVSKFHGPKYQIEYFDSFYEKLKTFLHCLPRNLNDKNNKATITFNSDTDAIIYVDGEEIARVNAHEFAKASLSLGEHLFLYKSAIDNASSYSESINFNSNRNYVVEIKEWKFKKRIKKWIKVVSCLVLIITIVWGVKGMLSQDTLPPTHPVVVVKDSLVTLITLGDSSYIYSGPIDDHGLPHGKGVAKFRDGVKGIYDGYFSHGIIEGHGVETYDRGDRYTGSFKNNKLEKGEYIWADGEKYIGTFVDDKPYIGKHYGINNNIKGVYDKGKYKETH